MQTDAVTSQAALTGSPRVSATTAKEIAPNTATAVQISFSRKAIVSPEFASGFSPLNSRGSLTDQQLFDQREHFLEGQLGRARDGEGDEAAPAKSAVARASPR